MASENENRLRSFHTSNGSASRPRLQSSNELRSHRDDGIRSTPVTPSQNHNSAANRRGNKRRVSDSTFSWHPRNKKRPRSEADISTARTLHFSPHAGPVHQVQKSDERSLEVVRKTCFYILI